MRPPTAGEVSGGVSLGRIDLSDVRRIPPPPPPPPHGLSHMRNKRTARKKEKQPDTAMAGPTGKEEGKMEKRNERH